MGNLEDARIEGYFWTDYWLLKIYFMKIYAIRDADDLSTISVDKSVVKRMIVRSSLCF